MTRRRSIIIAGSILVAAAAAVGIWLLTRPAPTKAAPRPDLAAVSVRDALRHMASHSCPRQS